MIDSPLVVSPLEYERRQLVRAGLDQSCELQVCGPGAAAIERWCATIDATDRPVILAGLAGALRPDFAAGTAHAIRAVMRVGDQPLIPPLHVLPGCTVASSATTLFSIGPKSELARQTGADLVDCESRAFAAFAVQRGWRWGIVRGISDPLHTHLPRGIDQWIDPSGRSRPWRIASSLLLRPQHLATTIRLGRDSARAMRSAAQAVQQLLSKTADPHGPL